MALTLLVSFMLVEVVAAWWSGSLALLADAGHMLADAGALAGALWALHLADRPAHGAMTYGWKRAEIIAAAANGLTLLLVGAFLGFEAVHRLLEPPPVTGLTMTFVAVVGVAVNLAATTVLSRASQTSLNVRAAYLHVLTDLYGFLGTLVAGLVIWRTGWHRADPLASLIVVGLMLHAGWSLTRDSGRILLEAAPTDLDLAEVRAHLLSLEHVVDVHDLHAWTVTSSLPALSAHVVLDDSCFLDAHAPQLLDQLQDCLHDHFDVAHSTFQLEPASHADHEEHGH